MHEFSSPLIFSQSGKAIAMRHSDAVTAKVAFRRCTRGATRTRSAKLIAVVFDQGTDLRWAIIIAGDGMCARQREGRYTRRDLLDGRQDANCPRQAIDHLSHRDRSGSTKDRGVEALPGCTKQQVGNKCCHIIDVGCVVERPIEMKCLDGLASTKLRRHACEPVPMRTGT